VNANELRGVYRLDSLKKLKKINSSVSLCWVRNAVFYMYMIDLSVLYVCGPSPITAFPARNTFPYSIPVFRCASGEQGTRSLVATCWNLIYTDDTVWNAWKSFPDKETARFPMTFIQYTDEPHNESFPDKVTCIFIPISA
jgi:hypothetical protein